MTINSLGSQELSYLSGMSATEGYQVLNKTMATAVTNFQKTPEVQSDISYFEKTVPTLTSVNQFLGNTRLVDFVLSAFGLDQEDNYQGLIKQVLTQDPSNAKSLVNQLSDPLFKQMASALDFYSDGLGKLQGLGLSDPTGASSVEGVTLASTTKAATVTAPVSTAPVATTTVNTNIAVGIGVTMSGGQYFPVQEAAGTSDTIGVDMTDDEYLQVQEPDGSTGYTQSGTFTLNSSNQLALSDGSLLLPSVTFPSDTTSVNITSSGQIEGAGDRSASPTVLGTLQTATFTDSTSLGQDSNGYYTPTSSSGTATIAAVSGTPTTYGATAYAQSAYLTVNSGGQLATGDGSTLYPGVTVPSDATSLTIASNGVIEAQEQGQSTPTIIGQLQTSTFSDSTQLTQDASGYYVPTTGSGSAATAATPSFTTYGATNQLVTTYSAASTSSSLSTSKIGVGIGLTGNNYLVLQQANGDTAYAQSAYFGINSQGELALADGSTLQPSITMPADTTAITVTSSGAVYAQEKGSAAPTNIGTLEVASFKNPSDLSKAKTGYLTPTANSGSAKLSFLSGTAYTFDQTNQDLINQYIQNEFETAVGSSNSAVREALYFQRTVGSDEKEIGATATSSLKADVILGDSVMDNVAETILDQPPQIAYEQLSRQEQIVENGFDLDKFTSSSSSSYIASLTARYLSMYDATTSAKSNAANSPALQILSAFSSGSSSSSSSSSSSVLSLLT